MLKDSDVRPPAVAGTFYPQDADALARDVDRLLAAAPAPATAVRPPFAIIAPHAGLIYSGPIAAAAYTRIAAFKDDIRRVVIAGPAHRVPVRGVALSSARAFRTPLGPVPQDRTAVARLKALPGVAIDDRAHEAEHSIEVHLPFLQRVLGEFEMVALVVGHAAPEEVADVLRVAADAPGTLLVVSSDLSHYLDYPAAQAIDRRTAQAILEGAPERIADEGACGRIPIKALLGLARERDLRPVLLDLRNSGDTAGPRDRVVGYASFLFEDPQSSALNVAEQEVLLHVAETAVRDGLESGAPPDIVPDGYGAAVTRIAASFVTLKQSNALRGCIGSLAARRPLVVDVAENAFAAAFRDPRFPPVAREDVTRLDLIQVSVLSAPRPLAVSGEDDLLGRLRPGRDGLILRDGERRATFLPQVWEQLPSRDAFLRRLKEKAGLAPGHWSPTLRFWRYETQSFQRRLNGEPAALCVRPRAPSG